MVGAPVDYQLFSTIIPTYDEVENIGKMIARLTELYPGMRILVMDDNSKDGTVELVRTVALTNKNVVLVVRDPADRGLTASVMDGIARVTTPYYLVMDSDFQHPPEVLGDLMAALLTGPALVIGKRFHKEALKGSRRISSDSAQFLAHSYLYVHRQPHPKDIMSGLFGAKTVMSQDILRTKGGRFERKGFKVLFDILKFMPKEATCAEVEYQFGDRHMGESKLSPIVISSILRQCGGGGKALAVLANMFLLKRSGQVALITIFVLLLAIAIFVH